jgi:hypothetical protein
VTIFFFHFFSQNSLFRSMGKGTQQPLSGEHHENGERFQGLLTAASFTWQSDGAANRLAIATPSTGRWWPT